MTPKMRLSVLLLLLGVTSATLQEIIQKSSQLQKASVLDPDPENRVNESLLAHLNHSDFMTGHNQSSFFTLTNTNLKWVTWGGSIPDGAVGIYNDYAGRYDYVCNCRCSAGFYSPSLGSYCRYPYDGKENLGSSFDILTNKGQLELLEWKSGSYGSVPANSINSCPGGEGYVGKNKYGLGKVIPKHEAFFLPWNGKEYWYKYYEVLTVKKDVYREHISNVKYKTDAAKIIQHPPETMQTFTITNNECQAVVKTVTLTTINKVERRWDTGFSIAAGVKATITAQIPSVGSTGIEFSTETTQQFSKGTTLVETIEHSVSVQLNVPPNHTCRVNMVGDKYTADIPFTARLERTYRNGETRSAYTTGTYDTVQVGDVVAVVERCEPVPGARPCV